MGSAFHQPSISEPLQYILFTVLQKNKIISVFQWELRNCYASDVVWPYQNSCWIWLTMPWCGEVRSLAGTCVSTGIIVPTEWAAVMQISSSSFLSPNPCSVVSHLYFSFSTMMWHSMWPSPEAQQMLVLRRNQGQPLFLIRFPASSVHIIGTENELRQDSDRVR